MIVDRQGDRLSRFVPPSYGPTVDRLLGPPPAAPADAPRHGLRDELARTTAEALFAPRTVANHALAASCQAALWLYHGFLDESHQISQAVDTVEGSYWHGIMHRAEGDYSNAKYWFRRVGDHPVGAELAAAVRDLTATAAPDRASAFLAEQTAWDHARFVDLCEAAAIGRSALSQLCQSLREREWFLLFDHCFRRACSDRLTG
jgi:hypothetical protein